MNQVRRLACKIAVLAGMFPHLIPLEFSCAQEATVAKQTDYRDWIKKYETAPISSWFGGEPVRVKLALTAIEGDEEALAADRIVSYGCQISGDRRVGLFYHSRGGHKGGGYPQLPKATLTRLDELIAQLPADGSHLPPPGRRLVLQTAESDRFQVRVYDRANASEQMLEILRLTGSGIRSWIPEFKPASQWTAYANLSDGALCLSPDGRSIISMPMHRPLKVWDIDSYKMIKEVAMPPDVAASGLVFSPDGSIAAIESSGEVILMDTLTWQRSRKLAEPTQYGLSCPQFTPDGRFLSLQSGRPGLLFFDTKNWDAHKDPIDLPNDVLAYVSDPESGRSIYSFRNENLMLWDTKQHHEVAKLDDNARISEVSFSPDKSMVAIATVHKGPGDYWTKYRIRIWKSATGELVHELKPFEQNTCEKVKGLLWSRDGKYVLAATKADSFFTSQGVGVWSIKSGRHRGEFIGCPTDVYGLVLTPDGRLIAGCNDGVIRVWDTIHAFKEIQSLEASLL